MTSPMSTTLLELGDATSQNLEFSHRRDVLLSYGEETITETNLLEIRRRHPEQTRLHMFTKHQESRNGADWEWHILGRRQVLKMRVQAKRLQRNNVLKVRHKVASSGSEQRDLLIQGALADHMKPVYCLYCTEPERSIWTQRAPPGHLTDYQTGCLLADAIHVPPDTKRLCQIEDKCIPWHFLFDRYLYARFPRQYATLNERDQLHFTFSEHLIRSESVDDVDAPDRPDDRWNPPNVQALNDGTAALSHTNGVHETTAEDRDRLKSDTRAAEEVWEADLQRLRERRVSRILVIDVRDQ